MILPFTLGDIIMNKYKILTILVALFSALGASSSYAQLNNQPFAFRGTPSGGLGMSIGGRQAILDNKIFGITPRNLVRGTSGILLDVTKGVGNTAIVNRQGGGVIPSYRGSSYKGANSDMAFGVFNSFFSPRQASSSSAAASLAATDSGSVVSTWTARIVSGGAPVSFSPYSSVDNWTSLVYMPN